MHSDLMWQTARARQADLRRAADTARMHRKPAAVEHGGDDARITLRLDRVWDSERLYELAEGAGRRLPPGRLVLLEVGGRVVAALPLAGGSPIAESSAATAHLVPLLELRAAQIRRYETCRRGLRRLLPNRV
jgi:hypothetical protein